MQRMLAALSIGVLAVGIAQADIGPPKGFKRVTVDYKIVAEKDYPDYQFFTVIGGGGKKAPKGKGVTAVKLDSKTPVVITGAGRGGVGRLCTLVAVPKDAAKSFDSEADFLEAVRTNQIEGTIRSKNNFAPFTNVKDSDTRKVIVTEYSLDKIDKKQGIVLVPKKESSEESEEPVGVTAYTPRGGMLIAGLAAALGVMLGGLWLSGRGRRRV